MRHYYVYILTNWNNKVLYTGVTNDISRRVTEHKMKTIDGFTKKYNINKLVYLEEFSFIKDAIAAEKKIKGWLRIKKIELIESRNPQWKDLSTKLEAYVGTLGIVKDSSLD
jgi:putative endonuclease